MMSILLIVVPRRIRVKPAGADGGILPPSFLFSRTQNKWRACSRGLTSPPCGRSSAVERYPSKLDVVGSIPIVRSCPSGHFLNP